MDIVDGKTDIRMVDVNSHAYRVANEYMIRLRKRDIEDKEYLEKLAKAGTGFWNLEWACLPVGRDFGFGFLNLEFV